LYIFHKGLIICGGLKHYFENPHRLSYSVQHAVLRARKSDPLTNLLFWFGGHQTV